MRKYIVELANQIQTAEIAGNKLELIRLMYKLIDLAEGSIEELLK